ncbi:MAG: hypothetical protein JWN14_1803 [Chthonomonadales bacterium]|nr:hypothetical protein [Chthonomonadales bacterium]
MNWTHAWPTITAAFLASFVEFVEALTIVLAVGIVRGWRSALIGVFSGVAFLTVLVLIFGPALSRVPIHALQLILGVLLLLFGLRWLRKAILRAAGVLKLHDETAAFEKEMQTLKALGLPTTGATDMIAVTTSFKAVTVEGLEVVFIVIATGAAARMLPAAALGATAAGLIVVLLGLAVHRPLAKVPENTLKFSVGVLLSAFGTFWTGEGVGLSWPGEDLSLFWLVAAFLMVGLASVPLARRKPMPVVETGEGEVL